VTVIISRDCPICSQLQELIRFIDVMRASKNVEVISIDESAYDIYSEMGVTTIETPAIIIDEVEVVDNQELLLMVAEELLRGGKIRIGASPRGGIRSEVSLEEAREILRRFFKRRWGVEI